MNLSELARQVRRHLAEAGTGVYNDDDVTAQVQRSARDLAKQHRLFYRTAALTPDAQGYAALPADFAGLKQVLSSGQQLAELRGTHNVYGYSGWSMDPADLDSVGKIRIHGTVRGPVALEYWAYPPELSGNAEAWNGLYSEYHDLIALHAAHQLSGGSGPSAAKEAIWLQRYQQRLDEFKSALVTERLNTRRVQFTSHTRFPSRRY